MNGSTASTVAAPAGATGEDEELVTVVIPARDEERTIAGVLDSVLAQTHRNLQVLVVDGVSEDATAEVVAQVAARDPRVELVVNPDRVIPMALNLGLARARGRWLVRVDAHSRIGEDYVERLVGHLRTGEWGGVGGRKDGVGHSTQGRAVAAVTGSRFAQGNSVYHYGTEVRAVDHVPFGAYSVVVARELGGWSETQLVNEDFEFDHRLRRAGHQLLFDPAAVIDWDCRQSVVALFRQYRRYGRGKVQTLVAHPDSVAVRHLAAPALVGLLGLAALLSVPRRTRRLAALLVSPYLAVVVAGTATTVPTLEDRAARRFVAPAFVALHVGWGLGFWLEAVATLRRRGGARPSMAQS